MMHTVTGTCTVAVYSIKWVFVDRNVHIDFTGSCGRDFHSSFVLHLFSLKYWKLSTCNMGMLANVLSDVIIILITIIQKALLLNDESSLSLQWVVFLGLMAAKENTTIELETQPYNSYSMTQWTVLFHHFSGTLYSSDIPSNNCWEQYVGEMARTLTLTSLNRQGLQSLPHIQSHDLGFSHDDNWGNSICWWKPWDVAESSRKGL